MSQFLLRTVQYGGQAVQWKEDKGLVAKVPSYDQEEEPGIP